MGPDAELFAEMAQDLLLGPSQASMDAQAAQPGYQGAHTGPHAAQYGNQPQAWQPPASQPAPSAQQQQQQQQQQPQQVVCRTYFMLMCLITLHTVPSSQHKPAGLCCNYFRRDDKMISCMLRCVPGPAGIRIRSSRRWQHACCTTCGSHLLAWPTAAAAAAADAAAARRPTAASTPAAAAAGDATAAARYATPACPFRRPRQDLQARPSQCLCAYGIS